MIKYLLTAVMVLALGDGCALFDAPEGEKSTAEGAAGIVAPIVNSLLPGAGTVLVGVAAGIAEWRRRKWKGAATAMATGINAARDLKDASGNIPETALINAQVAEQERLKVRTVVCKLVDQIEKDK